ncbi:MAG: energy transducer TonB [Nitrospirae bacterium]|nr:energy transducer TonB [Nitrospirota bacterium]
MLFGILGAVYPSARGSAGLPVFYVDIVGPVEVPVSPPKKIDTSRMIEEKRLPNGYKQPSPSDTDLSPKTLYGEGTDMQEDGDLKNSSSDTSSDKKGSSQSGTDGGPLKPKSFLFDKETIEKFSKKDFHKERELTFDTSELKHRGYMRMLREKIENIWKYPLEAARFGISGDLYIKFFIKKDGRLADVEMMRTSGHKDLDEAAIKAVKDAQPYWPLPEDWDEDVLEITGHFFYFLGGYYIM